MNSSKELGSARNDDSAAVAGAAWSLERYLAEVARHQ